MWWARDGVALLSCLVPHESRVVPTSGCVNVLDMCEWAHDKTRIPGVKTLLTSPRGAKSSFRIAKRFV